MRLLYMTLITLFLGHFPLHSTLEEDRLRRRIEAHLTLEDVAAAREEARIALARYPASAPLHESTIKVLARLGDEKAMLQEWEDYAKQFPENTKNRELIEEMAWGVLTKASSSSSLIMRQMALLAAYYSHEGRGVAILHQGMRDPNYAIRAVAVKMAGHYRDRKLVEEVKRLFKQEKVWEVRKRVLEAIGHMKIDSMRGELELLIASNESLPSEKALAIASLLELLDTVNRPEVERLASSNRAGLRQLACKAIAYFQSKRDLDLLLRLTIDSHPDVRQGAFQAYGQVRPESSEEIFTTLRKGIQDANPQVAISAAWLLAIYAPQEGQQAFKKYLLDDRRDVRILAAAALSTAGRYGMPLMLEQFRENEDSYVRMNLALGLIGQRTAIPEASACLRQMLMTSKEKWSKNEMGLFSMITNKSSRKPDDPLGTPESENQLVRLEMLNILAIVNDPHAQEAIRDYLMERSWGISAAAVALLLTEGDESAVEIVQKLLQDPQPRVRLQAALVLSIWGREESAIRTLEDSYPETDWETKSRILEGVGRIGSMQSVPFLISVLKEPSQTLRLIAGMALIQCVNH